MAKTPKSSDNPPKRRKKTAAKANAESMAAAQRDISVSEFFAKNRHLLGFDNPRKALLTTVKEAVDNALDACEEAGILPHIRVEIAQPANAPEDRYTVAVQDNGPGIVRKQIEHIFGRLLYGSKFHRLKMSRGQQGIGISAAGMYGLITTGKPVRIISRTSTRKPAHEVVLKMDTSKNRAQIVKDEPHPEDNNLFDKQRFGTGTGTRVEIELQGKYLKGNRSVDEYLQLTAIANPHATIELLTPPTSALPKGEHTVYERSIAELPDQPEEIKPHPHGIELGTLISMLERTNSKQLGGFFKDEFCRIGPKVAQSVADNAGLTTRSWVNSVNHHQAEKLYEGLQSAKVMGPPTNCLSPIGVRTLLKGLQQGLTPDFIAASSRPPAVYRGRPFVIEAGVAFGGDLPADESAKIYRFANRVPLQYQQSACASFKSVIETNWRSYNLQQPRGAVPVAPMIVMIHMASVWVPFTSESKEAIADYDEIRKEMRLALQECGRKLGSYLKRRQRIKRQGERRGVFLRYIGEISKACHHITGADQQLLYDQLMAQAQQKTAEFDAQLDEEGKFVKRTDDRLADDEGVFIRTEPTPEPPQPAHGSNIDLEANAQAHESTRDTNTDDSTAENLWGDPDPAPTTTKSTKPKAKAKTKTKTKTKKKILRKVRRKPAR